MVQDVLGAGKSLEALEKLTREARELMLRLLGPAADAAGDRLADWINPIRSKNFERVVNEVLERLRSNGIQAQPVELKLLVPILQHSSLEAEDDLVSKWAGLLASAAAGESVHPSYPRILAELTPVEARILDQVYDEIVPESVENWATDGCHVDRLREKLPNQSLEKGIQPALDNLFRLRLCQPAASAGTGVGGLKGDIIPVALAHYEIVCLTPFGYRFVSTCRGPRGHVSEKTQYLPTE